MSSIILNTHIIKLWKAHNQKQYSPIKQQNDTSYNWHGSIPNVPSLNTPTYAIETKWDIKLKNARNYRKPAQNILKNDNYQH